MPVRVHGVKRHLPWFDSIDIVHINAFK